MDIGQYLKMKHIPIIMAILFFGCNSENNKTGYAASTTLEVAKVEAIKQEMQDGDIIFQTSLSSQSLPIQIATKSKYSHVGLIYKNGADFFVYEAVQPIKLTPLEDWINRGEGEKYVVKRLINSEDILTPEGVLKMKNIGKKYLGKDYDLKFEWTDDKIYCSELVWKIYHEAFNIELGNPQRLKEFDLSDKLVKAKLKERYGNNIPMEELVVTPDRIFKAENLTTIMEQ